MLREAPLSETDDNTSSPRSERRAYYLNMVRSMLLFVTTLWNIHINNYDYNIELVYKLRTQQ